MFHAAIRRAVLPAALIAGLAVPAAASATPTSPAKQARQAAVRSHQAVVRLQVAVQSDDVADAATALRQARREAAAASRQARRLAGAALAGRENVQRAVIALRATTQAYDEHVDAFAALVDDAPADVAEQIAAALAPSMNGRELAINLLTQLMPLLPEQAQQALAAFIARFADDPAQDVEQLDDAMEDSDTPAEVKPVLADLIANATALVQVSLTRLEALSAQLPEAAQQQIEAALTLVNDQLSGVLQIVQQATGVATELPGATVGNLTQAGTLIGSILDGVVKPVLGSLPSFLPTNLVSALLPSPAHRP